jgi:hypothetical protein
MEEPREARILPWGYPPGVRARNHFLGALSTLIASSRVERLGRLRIADAVQRLAALGLLRSNIGARLRQGVTGWLPPRMARPIQRSRGSPPPARDARSSLSRYQPVAYLYPALPAAAGSEGIMKALVGLLGVLVLARAPNMRVQRTAEA